VPTARIPSPSSDQSMLGRLWRGARRAGGAIGQKLTALPSRILRKTTRSSALAAVRATLIAGVSSVAVLFGTGLASDIQAQQLTFTTPSSFQVAGAGQGKRGVWRNGATVGGSPVDIVAVITTATLDHIIEPINNRPGIRASNPDEIWVQWSIYAPGTYNIATNSGGVPVTARAHVQFNDIDGPTNERVFVPVCTGAVEWIRIDRTATTGRSFGTVAGRAETFSLIGDIPYANEPVSGVEILYPNTSRFEMGRTANQGFVVILNNPTYTAFNSFDYVCADFTPPVAANDTQVGVPGTPTVLNILLNDSIATDNNNGPANNTLTPGEFGLTTINLIPPTGATGVVTDAQGDVTGFTVPGQGTYSVNDTNGQLRFTPIAGFTGQPTPINYTFKNALGVASNPATVTINYPGIGLVKSSVFNDELVADGNAQVGETITYTYRATNPSPVPLSTVTVTETGFTGAGTDPVPAFQSGDSNGNNQLDQGETWIYTASYTIVAADLTAGGVSNQGTATGRTPTNELVSDVSDSSNPGDGNGVGTPGGGPNNDTPTTTPLTPAPINAVDDTPPGVNGVPGGNLPSVLANDTLNGAVVDPDDIVLTPGTAPTPTAGSITMNPDGTITVAAGTTPGTYTYPYRICEELSPANCDDAIATVVVTPPNLVADDDDFSATPANGVTGGTAGNAYTGDTLNGTQITAAQVTPTVTTPATPIGGGPVPFLVTGGASEGQVRVPVGTPAGTYTIGYQICETAVPLNCDQAEITVVVAPPNLVADDDDFSATPVNGGTGGTAGDAYAGDTLNGTQVTAAQVTPTVTTPATSIGGGPVPVLATSGANEGQVTVPPGTPAGTYTIGYQICETAAPTNCDQAVITVEVAPSTIAADDDDFSTTPVNGLTGGTAGNAYTGDTLNGTQVTPAQVIPTVLTPATSIGGGPVPVLATSGANEGQVTVPAGTPAGTYTIDYRICEVLNSGNCDDARVTVVVAPPVIAADDDNFSTTPVNGLTGGTAGNAYTGDTLNGTQVTPAQVVPTVLTPATPIRGGPVPVLATSGANEGQVTVPAGTPSGTYTIDYRICETLNAGNCDDATITVVVAPPAINAVNNTFPAVSGLTGGSTPSVLGNDTLNGIPVVPAAITLTPGTAPAPTAGSITMNPDGTITIAPGTTAGSYPYTYQICEVLNPANCDTAVATVIVNQPAVDARPETVDPIIGGAPPGVIFNVLTSDVIGGVPATPANVVITLISIETAGGAPYPEVTLNPATGEVSMTVPSFGAVVEVTYQICDAANPTNCDTQTETIPILPLEFEALPEAFDPINGVTGGTLTVGGAAASIIDSDLVESAPATLTPGSLTSVVIPAPVPGDYTNLATGAPVTFLSLNPLTGVVTVAPNTPAGTYGIFYEICDPFNPNSCDGITETVVVQASLIDAVDDAPTAVNGATGATTLTVLGNDTLNGAPVNPADITLTPGTAPTPASGSITMNPDGTIDVAPGTTAGTYTYNYEICEILNPLNCDEAQATVVVERAPITAVDETLPAVIGAVGATTTSVLVNDTLNGNPVDPDDITLTPGPAPTPASGSITMNSDGTITVAPGTTAGTYTYTYEICEVLNPRNCDTAQATVNVVPSEILAVDDTPATLGGVSGGTIPTVLGNDTLNGDPVDPADITLTPGTTPTPASGSIVMNSDGTITVAPGTTAGTYFYEYTICENLNPGQCSTATATVIVDQSDILAVEDTPDPVSGITGATIPSVLENDLLNGAPLDPDDITLTPGTAPTPPAGSIRMNPDGTITVAPGTTAGSYPYEYTICEKLNPGNCSPTFATVVVDLPIIEAVDDTPAPVSGATGATIPTVFANDTLNGDPLDPDDIVLTPDPAPTPASGSITMNPDGTITVAPGTTAGTYDYDYTICEVLNSGNCSTATATVVVDETPIDAVDDTPAEVDGSVGATIPTVLGNDTLGGDPVDPDDIVLTPGTAPTPTAGSITMNPDGTITVAPGTTAGTYIYTYEICEVLNPDNCDEAQVTILIDPKEILAEDDDFTDNPIDPETGGTAGNVFGNDTVDGDPVVPADVTVTITDPDGLTGLTLSPTGDLIIPAGATAGTYQIEYQICEILNPTNCDTAIATVVIGAPEGTTLVDDISAGNIPGTPVTVRVLGNDNDPSNIFDRSTLTILGTSGPGEPLVVPGEGTWTVDLATGSITFTPEPGFTGNPTPIQYQVTDIFGNLLDPASVVILYEFNAAFICSEVIGKVFDDKNQDGQQDEGEPGIAGARLATVNGDIITTDEYGRYSVPCAAIPEDIGSTFLLKLDPRSLPTGYRLTTENPKTVRLTQGTMRRMNFGATISNLVRVDLTEEAFDPETGKISKALDDGLKSVVAAVAKKPSTIRVSYYVDGGDPKVAKKRLDLVERRLRELWRGRGNYQLSLEKTIVERK
jgi:CshA-type fibril repeat protein